MLRHNSIFFHRSHFSKAINRHDFAKSFEISQLPEKRPTQEPSTLISCEFSVKDSESTGLPCGFQMEINMIRHIILNLVVAGLYVLPRACANEVDLGLEPPALNTQPRSEYADDVRTGNMIIGIDRTPKGRLWACWVGNGDNPNGFFMLATSDDAGATWSKPVRFADGCTLNKPTVLSSGEWLVPVSL